MPIKNYTTEVPAEKTIEQITALLVRKGAKRISLDYYGDETVKGIAFSLQIQDRLIPFQLPVNVDGVAGVLLKDKPFRGWSVHKCYEADYNAKVRKQARGVAWRIVKDWLEAQMALIEAGQAEVAQIFLPYLLEQDGSTLYSYMMSGGAFKRLGTGA